MPPSRLSIEQKILRYDTICRLGLDKVDNRHDPKWKEAYQIVFGKEYMGAANNNPLYAWFWVKSPHLNQQDPRLAQERDRQEMEEIGCEIAAATLNLRALTGKEDVLLAVPLYQYSRRMWWEKHVSQRWMEIVKRIGSIRQNRNELSTEREEELEHYLASGLEPDNEAAYESFLSELVRNAETNVNKSGHVCLFLQAIDVPLDQLPIKHRPYFTTQAFSDLAKKKLDECAYKKYLDVIARSRREILQCALEYIDFIEEYRERSRYSAAQMAFKRWCRDVGFGCPCAACDLSHEHISLCQIQHVCPWVKKMHSLRGRMAHPSELTAEKLWEQFMACFGDSSVELELPLKVGEEKTMGIPPLQPRCLPQHTEEDGTLLFKLLCGEIDMNQQTTYDAKRVANHRLITTAIRAINGDSCCYLDGSVLHPKRHPSEHQDHITEECNLKVVAEDGSSVVYSTAKDCIISAYTTESTDEVLMKSTYEVLKTRQSQGDKHLLLSSILKSQELMFVLGLRYPYQVKNNNIIFPEHYLERPPSVFVEDDGSTMQERLEDVFSRDESRFVTNQSYPWSNVRSCLCDRGRNCPAGCNAKRKFIDCAICETTHIVAESCADDASVDLTAADWTCKLCSDGSIINAQSTAVAASVSVAVADEQPRRHEDSKPASKPVTETIVLDCSDDEAVADEQPRKHEDSKPASKPVTETIVLDCSDDDEPIVESSSKPATSFVNGNKLSNVKAKHQLKSDAASSTSLKSDANPGSAMKSDPEYWADVAKFQKETEDLKKEKEKRSTYADWRDAPDSDDDSESEDMSTNEESIPTRSFKRLKRHYEIGDEAHTDDMDLQQSRSDKVQYFSSLNIGDGAFLKRSSGRWEFTRIYSKRANIIAFKAGDDGYKFANTTIESHFDILRKKKI